MPIADRGAHDEGADVRCHIVRISLLADERGQSSIDPAIVNTATILLHLETAKSIVMPLPKPRSDRVSRG